MPIDDKTVEARLSLLGLQKEAADGEYGFTNAVDDVREWLNTRDNTKALGRSLSYFAPRALVGLGSAAVTQWLTGRASYALGAGIAGTVAADYALPHIQKWLKDRTAVASKEPSPPPIQSPAPVEEPVKEPAELPPGTVGYEDIPEGSQYTYGFYKPAELPGAPPAPVVTPAPINKPQRVPAFVRTPVDFEASFDMNTADGQERARQLFTAKDPRKSPLYMEAYTPEAIHAYRSRSLLGAFIPEVSARDFMLQADRKRYMESPITPYMETTDRM